MNMDNFEDRFPRDRRMCQRHNLKIVLRVRLWKSDIPEQSAESINLSEHGIFFATDALERFVLDNQSWYKVSSRLEMNVMGQEPKALIAADQVGRRRHARYRLQEPLLIRRNDGSSYPATTSEISISGLSAATTGVLRAGEEVRLSPVVGEQVGAIVRRRFGRMYGFEFTSVPPKVEEKINFLCKGLVAIRGLSEDEGSSS